MFLSFLLSPVPLPPLTVIYQVSGEKVFTKVHPEYLGRPRKEPILEVTEELTEHVELTNNITNI